MLYSADTGKPVTKMPHKKEFDSLMKKLSASDYQAIENELNIMIDSSEINTAGWLPGHDWTGTVFQPIYIACGQDKALAGMFFGLILFNILMNRQDKKWGFGRYELNGKKIESMTYFELDGSCNSGETNSN